MIEREELRNAVASLAAGELSIVPVRAKRVLQSPVAAKALFPGAFNPLHDGHRRMALLAERKLDAEVVFELSLENVDKQSISVEAVVERLTQFAPQQTICLTRSATFCEKAQLFLNSHFVVGADTVERIADSRYYDNDDASRDCALLQLVDSGVTFLVFGRYVRDRFQTIDDLALPTGLREICVMVSEQTFRMDISSTELRAGKR